MDCFLALTRFLFFIFTFSLWVVGVVGFSFAIYFIVEYDYLHSTADNYTLSYVSTAVIVFAVLLVVLGFLGCCGTCKDSKWMLYLFAVILSVLLLGEIALSIYCLVERENISDDITHGLEKTAAQYLEDESTVKAWDSMQESLKCCGIDKGPTDWAQYIGAQYIPESCCDGDACSTLVVDCPSDNDQVTAECVPVTSILLTYQEGCATKINDSLKDNFAILAACGIVFAFLQLLGVFSAVHIGSEARKHKAEFA